MGPEYLVIAVAAFGLVAMVLLGWRAVRKASRADALPTLIFSAVAGGYLASGSTVQNQLMSFLAYFLGAALIFGAHAHAIRWLRDPK